MLPITHQRVTTKIKKGEENVRYTVRSLEENLVLWSKTSQTFSSFLFFDGLSNFQPSVSLTLATYLYTQASKSKLCIIVNYATDLMAFNVEITAKTKERFEILSSLLCV